MYIFQMIDGLDVGGAQQLLCTFAGEARKRGFKLVVISLDDGDGSPYLEQFRSLGLTVHFFPTTRIFDFKNLYKIAKLFWAERPDILHTHLTYSNIIGAMIARLTGVPVVSTIHSIGVDSQFHAPWTERMEAFVLRNLVHKVIACGPAVAKFYRATVKNEPVLVIPNAVNSSEPSPTPSERADLRKQITGDVERPIIISVGRVVAQKGFADLVDAFFILRSSHPKAFLVIVGDGVYQKTIEEKIKDLSLSDHVRLLGRRTDVPRLLMSSDIYALASYWEGLPISVLEAMAAGLPILTTDVGDNAWAMGAAGVTVPPHRPDMLARVMIELLDDPARCKSLGLAARKRIEEEFDPSVWFEKTVSVYNDLLHI